MNIEDKDRNALLTSMKVGDEELVQLLLDEGADIGYVDRKGNNVFMEAVRDYRVGCLRRVLEY